MTPRLRVDDRHLLDYFTAEVLPAISSEQRELLVRAAPLERLSGALCDAALQVTGSREVLAALDRADLFLVALDDDHEWYRCHHLFRDVLLREPGARSETGGREVLRRAADWFLQQDRRDDAVRHLLRADDPNAAAQLLESSEPWFFDRGAAATFLVIGELLPPSTVPPNLAISLAYACATSGRLDRVGHWLDLADAGISPDTEVHGWQNPRAAALMLRALIGTPDKDAAEAEELCRRAVELETAAAGGQGLQVALAALGSALARDGRFAEAAEILAGTWQDRDSFSWSPGVTLQIGGNLGLSLLELGRDGDLEALLREALPLVDGAERRWGDAAGPVVAMLRLVQGRALYLRSDAAGARTVLNRAVSLAELAALPTSLFLAGDAARLHSPAGGQGMNTGIQDGYALGRALATERLDDYDAQRRPVAEKVVAFADRMTRIATTHHPLLRGARNIALPALGRLPAFRTRLATEVVELNYR